MKNLTIFIILILTAIACSKNQDTKQSTKYAITDSVIVNGHIIKLINNQGVAELQSIDKLTVHGKIKMAPPCYFVRFENKLRKYEYPQIGVQASLMIIGDTILDRNNPRQICGKSLQGISLNDNNEIIISKRIINARHFCLDSWIDEKEFSSFSSEQ